VNAVRDPGDEHRWVDRQQLMAAGISPEAPGVLEVRGDRFRVDLKLWDILRTVR